MPYHLGSDGKGQETKQPFSDWVDVVLFSADPNDFSADNQIPYQQRHKIESGETAIELLVDTLPAYAVIDPSVRFIDRESKNNIIKLWWCNFPQL